MISGDACDEQGRRCMCFNESSDVEVKCGCLPGYKREVKGDTFVCSGMLVLNFMTLHTLSLIINNGQTERGLQFLLFVSLALQFLGHWDSLRSRPSLNH